MIAIGGFTRLTYQQAKEAENERLIHAMYFRPANMAEASRHTYLIQ
jgi:hypothetical protein